MKFVKHLEQWGRRRTAALPGVLPDREEALPADPSRILVIRTDNRLGNLVLLEPLLRSIRIRFPQAELDILASDVFSELLEYQGYNVIKMDKKGQIRNPARFVNLIRKLRSKSYDVAIDAAHPHSFSLSGAIGTVLSGAGCRISTDAGDSSGWYTNTVAEPPIDWHESRALHSLGSVWGNWPEWSPPELHFTEKGKREAAGLHAGASGNKKYPLELLENLVDRICRKVILEVYWGSDEERETALYLKSRYPVAVMPKLSVAELIERIAGLKLFITSDNGPMHIASAVSVPVIALFRIDNMNRFAPLSEGSKTLFANEGPEPDIVAAAVLEAY
ncbi:MAG: glycosyltransferase family 9 protein [Candidatus Aegiribacteria sp.]|nr:glycosyltransferase family 9 protein [Candidatus Aegiribacteria sp.]